MSVAAASARLDPPLRARGDAATATVRGAAGAGAGGRGADATGGGGAAATGAGSAVSRRRNCDGRGGNGRRRGGFGSSRLRGALAEDRGHSRLVARETRLGSAELDAVRDIDHDLAVVLRIRRTERRECQRGNDRVSMVPDGVHGRALPPRSAALSGVEHKHLRSAGPTRGLAKEPKNRPHGLRPCGLERSPYAQNQKVMRTPTRYVRPSVSKNAPFTPPVPKVLFRRERRILVEQVRDRTEQLHAARAFRTEGIRARQVERRVAPAHRCWTHCR